ncbi:MAG TPA: alpha/beta hydrolase [Pseudonocardiaceae bacterium]
MLRRAVEAVVPLSLRGMIARRLLALPPRVQRRLAGEPIRIDGQELALEAQLVLRISGRERPSMPLEQSRRRMRAIAVIAGGRRIEPVAARDLAIENAAGPIPARLYRPAGLAAPSPLLVYYHGGGWVEGDLESHDNLCRFLALHAGTAVLAVDYRLAPEHPFPAGLNDALAALRYAAAHAEELGVDPRRIAVGGDSAGGNLAAVVAGLAAADEVPPSFLLMIYPGTDAVEVAASRTLFGSGGFLLTEERIQWFLDQYLPDHGDRRDPRASPLREPRPERLPPTYLVTAGFDPLRDEGEAFAALLAAAGVPVALHRFPDLYHGFASSVGLGRRPREAMLQVAGALRAGLAFGRRPGPPQPSPS